MQILEVYIYACVCICGFMSEKNWQTEWSKSDEFIKQESQRYNVSVLIYHYQDFKRWHQVLKDWRW